MILSVGGDDNFVDELAILPTGGRLDSFSHKLIEANLVIFCAQKN
jgi:hypothetical protein